MTDPKEGHKAGRIVMAGLPPELESQLLRRLRDFNIKSTSSGSGALMSLAEEETSVLILDHRLREPSALDVLSEVRRSQGASFLPVIYCLDNQATPDLPSTLVRSLGVGAVLYHPLDADELIRQAASLSGNQSLARAVEAEKSANPPESPLDGLQQKFVSLFLERVEVLERAGLELLEGRLTPDLRKDAEREAHRLAGSLGTLGFHAGSRFAQEVEKILQHGVNLSEQQALRLSELVVALRLDIERRPASANELPPTTPRPHPVLLVSGDDAFSEKLCAEAAARGLELECVPDIGAARDWIENHEPFLAILDLGRGQSEEESWEWMEELSARVPPVPAVVLTGKDTLVDRVEVVRRGGRGFLPRSLSAGQVMDFTLRLVERLRASETKILAVDDDPQVLEALQALLGPRGLRVTALEDPLKFWEVFNQVSPDLLILDVDMPHLTGIELCHVVRNDPQRAEVPILFLTAHSDPDTVRRVFSAGADDFVTKPIIGPELLTRIFNRVERSRLRRSLLEIDPLTGVFNRRKSRQVLEDFIRLASRHGQPMALGVINLDHLRKINERSGYGGGDSALRKLGQLMQRHFHSEDAAARWGGEDFVVGMYGMSRYDGVQRLAELLEAFRQGESTNPEEAGFQTTFSAGVAEYPEDANDVEGLFLAAAEAMRMAKAAGRDRVLPAGSDSTQREKLHSADVALVMADEAEAHLLLNALQTRGYRARWLQDGKTALKMLGGERPILGARIILIEVELPGMDGLSLLKHLASSGSLKESKVIMLTSPAVGNDAQAALQLGAFDQVVKPFNPPVVVQRIRRALES
ncbi:MAG TPA: response regulator [Terriglobia bacterium]|nr:response regulator [Terriglobia bacterium]